MTLLGLRILNTRPLGQHLLLSQEIEALGGVAIHLPLIAIEPTPTTWVKELPPLSQVHHAIFISPNAVHHFFKGLKNVLLPKSIQITAIGKGTKNALLKWGIHCHHMPPIADNEHLLQMPIFQTLHCQNILIVKGIGGRTAFIQTLIQRGAILHSVDVYQRVLPKINESHLKSLWQDDGVDIILLTSKTAIYHLFALFEIKAHAWLRRTPCVVISERIAKTARAYGMQHVKVCTYDTLLTSLESRNF